VPSYLQLAVAHMCDIAHMCDMAQSLMSHISVIWLDMACVIWLISNVSMAYEPDHTSECVLPHI